jgi:hypothetical protein
MYAHDFNRILTFAKEGFVHSCLTARGAEGTIMLLDMCCYSLGLE